MSDKIPVLVTPGQRESFEAKAQGDVSTWMRELAIREVAGGAPIPGSQFIGEASFDVPIMGSTHGGPGGEAIPEDVKSLGITESMADELGAEEGDRFLKVVHDSMAEAGIVDGSYVLCHFLDANEDPSRYQIALVAMYDDSGTMKTTIKRWLGWESPGRPRLEDGAGNRFEIPEGVEAHPIMVARAVLTKL